MTSSTSSRIDNKPSTHSHKNAPLTPEGRKRLIELCRTRPIAHVAAEMGISRATASKWVNRYRRFGDIGLLDRSSAPLRQPTAIPGDAVARIEQLRREHKGSASRIAFEMHADGTVVSRRTITRRLAQLGLNRRRFIDPNGENNREVKTITARHPGHMVHLDVKKVGRIPDGGGWRVHGKNSPEAPAAARANPAGCEPDTPTCTRRSTGTRAWRIPNHLRTNGPPTASQPSAHSLSAVRRRRLTGAGRRYRRLSARGSRARSRCRHSRRRRGLGGRARRLR